MSVHITLVDKNPALVLPLMHKFSPHLPVSTHSRQSLVRISKCHPSSKKSWQGGTERLRWLEILQGLYLPLIWRNTINYPNLAFALLPGAFVQLHYHSEHDLHIHCLAFSSTSQLWKGLRHRNVKQTPPFFFSWQHRHRSRQWINNNKHLKFQKSGLLVPKSPALSYSSATTRNSPPTLDHASCPRKN